MIKTYYIKISDRLPYVPFNNNFSFDDKKFNSYDGSLNNNRIDRLNLKITFSLIDDEFIKIHSLYFGVYKYSKDCKFTCTYNFHNIHGCRGNLKNDDINDIKLFPEN